MSEYDLIVIGAGPVGENIADRAVRGGLSAVIVESELVGGDCSYWACMPSKALLRSGAALRAARAVAGAREAATGALNASAVLKRRDRVVSNWTDDGQVGWLESAGIELVRGHGRLDGVKRVVVETGHDSETVLTARHAVAISTGTSALLPKIPGLAEAQPWTAREATSAQQIPGRLAIIGGGVVACELASAYLDLGTEVTVIARSSLLTAMEPFAGERVIEVLRERGATVLLGRSPLSVDRDETGVRLVIDDETEIHADEVLVAAGRTPRTEALGLETVGLKNGDWLAVDEAMRVLNGSAPVTGGDGTAWLYAAGDVNHRALLTHQGKYQARALGDLIVAQASGTLVDEDEWGAHAATADHRALPQVVFTDPEIASAGLTAKQAEEHGYRIRTVDYEIGNVAGAFLHASRYRGTARIVVDEDRRVLLGATFVGQDVSELLHSATVAIAGEVPLHRLWHAVPSYPTLSEVWLRLLEGYGRESALGNKN